MREENDPLEECLLDADYVADETLLNRQRLWIEVYVKNCSADEANIALQEFDKNFCSE